ncbi:alpha-protein kinase 1 isoform X1 [Condylostylus longicornis]|uniref:alpha-protein kinase 1 isoform X1 n=1 Tax=Condylostylus longicornis TaxID=2530218 RepID=UPI00244DD9C5|nr:alpha-protein kinase 1 isoform X1 [Condylostylus longicornis]
MKSIILCVVVLFGLCNAQQGTVDPAYLRQYYQQIAQQSGAAGGSHGDATPIFEQNSEQSQQYIQPGPQHRLKDNVQDQIRAQQSPQHTQAYVAPTVREYLHQQQPQQFQYVQPQHHAPQAVNYKAAPQAPKQQLIHRSSGKQGGKLSQEEPEEYDTNPSYQFGFDVKDDEFTNYQNRKEVRDGNVITGSYSVVDSDGFIRTVKYTADPKEGFKAEVIREPTDIVIKIPTPPPQQLLRQPVQAGPSQHQHSQPQYQQYKQQQQQQQPQYQQYHQ